MSRTFQVKKLKFCQMITKVWENDFQAFLVDFIFENVGDNGRLPAITCDLAITSLPRLRIPTRF